MSTGLLAAALALAVSTPPGLPEAGKKYQIREGGYACDHGYKATCGKHLYMKGKYINFKLMVKYEGLDHNPATKWEFELQGDGTYKIFTTHNAFYYTPGEGVSKEFNYKTYWTAVNYSLQDWITLSDDDNGDTWRLAPDPNYNGTFRIYPNKNCEKRTWPCNQIVTWEKISLKLDNSWEEQNQVSFKFEETYEIHEQYQK